MKYIPLGFLPGFKDPGSSIYFRLGVKDKDQKSQLWAPLFDPVPHMDLQMPLLIYVNSFICNIFFLDYLNWSV